MKKSRTNIDRMIDRLDERWKALPMRKQHRYALYFLAFHLALTAVAVWGVWYRTGRPKSVPAIQHIENPTIKRNEVPERPLDSLPAILKQKIYEMSHDGP